MEAGGIFCRKTYDDMALANLRRLLSSAHAIRWMGSSSFLQITKHNHH